MYIFTHISDSLFASLASTTQTSAADKPVSRSQAVVAPGNDTLVAQSKCAAVWAHAFLGRLSFVLLWGWMGLGGY